MELKTYRASSLQAALQLVRQDLGPQAAVLHTREVRAGFFRWLPGRKQVEVTASLQVHVPSRFRRPDDRGLEFESPPATPIEPVSGEHPAAQQELQDQLDNLHSLVEQLCQKSALRSHGEMPDVLFRLFTDLIEAGISQEFSRELIDRLQHASSAAESSDATHVRARLVTLIEKEIRCRGPIEVPPDQSKLVALVGPTGVGKTTTIAKLAANFHLRDRRRVGLITVDTYRIAAVDQLRTYADIIDLPMEVVSSLKEIRPALERMAGLELILMDTAGRSPRDDVQIQELKSVLAAAEVDEVHLVLSAAASAANMKHVARRFTGVGVDALILTKLDEVIGAGGALDVLRSCGLPLSYVTDGQDVPRDIATADPQQLARSIVAGEEA